MTPVLPPWNHQQSRERRSRRRTRAKQRVFTLNADQLEGPSVCVRVCVCPKFSHTGPSGPPRQHNWSFNALKGKKKQNFPLLKIPNQSAAAVESNTSLTVAGPSLASFPPAPRNFICLLGNPLCACTRGHMGRAPRSST